MKRSGLTCVLAGMGLWLGCAVGIQAQGPAGPAAAPSAAPAASAAAGTFEYEVASIKPHDKNADRIRFTTNADSVDMEGPATGDLIRWAYGLDMSEDVVGVPAELKKANWDVHAKTDADTAAALKKLGKDQRTEAYDQMMRTLLADRFKLKAHIETKDGPIYALVLAKGGFKLVAAESPREPKKGAPVGADGKPVQGQYVTFRPGQMSAHGITITQFAQILQGQVDRKIVDRTGVAGKFDFELKFTTGTGGKESGADESLPSLFTALEEQMGLRLESTRGPVRSVVVEHIEMPSEN